MTIDVLILLLAFQLKHFVADYPMQTMYMHMGKGSKKRWFLPLLSHASVHGALTVAILAVYFDLMCGNDSMTKYGALVIIYASLFDVVTHFVTDRWKATRGVGPETPSFWIYPGIDQMIHHMVGILIVFYAWYACGVIRHGLN